MSTSPSFSTVDQGHLEDTIKSIIIGLMVNKKRVEQKKTLQALAKEAKVSKSFISDVERGGMVKVTSNKLASVAVSLGFEIDAIRNLNLSDIQKHEDYREILQTFNTLDFLFLGALRLNPQDVAGMIRASGDNGVTLAKAIKDLFINRGITDRNIIEAIIRASQSETDEFRRAREREADQFCQEKHFPHYTDTKGPAQGEYAREFQSDFLMQVLESEYGYQIDSTTLKQMEDAGNPLPDTSWVFIQGDAHRNRRLLMHPHLSASHKTFLLAREIYFARHNITERPWYTRQIYTTTTDETSSKAYDQRWSFTQGGYFAGAMLLPRAEITQRLSNVFSNETWDPDAFLQCAMTTTSTTFFMRMGEIMSEEFGIKEYRYMRFDRSINKNQRKYQITNSIDTLQGLDRDSYRDLELAPNARYLHHCRRWLGIDMTENFDGLKTMSRDACIVKARRARYVSGPQEVAPTVEGADYLDLFVFSILSPLPVADRYRIDTIAFKCDDAFKALVKFWNDKQCTYGYELEGHACEMCSIKPCDQRVTILERELTDHWLLEEWKERKGKKKQLEAFRQSFLSKS